MNRESRTPRDAVRRARVLLGDPHALVLEGLRGLVESRHRVVDAVTDGEALVSSARRLRPDVVVMEVRLPAAGGLEAARRLLAHEAGPRVLFVTAVDDPAAARQALALGASGYMLKSATSASFLDGLGAVLAGRRVLSPRLAGADPGARPGCDADARPPRLGPRAQEVIRLLTRGHSMKQVGAALGITPRTVAFHKYRAMKELGLGSTAALVRYAVETGLFGPEPARTAAPAPGPWAA